MKKLQYSFLTISVALLALISVSFHARAANITPVNNLSPKASLFAEIPSDTVIRFPDPNFEAAVRETICKPMGDITASDVAGIRSLSLDERGIVDLTGIEYFTALESLSCAMNSLTILDVSRNAMLMKLDCSENYDLVTLDVSQNPMLESLSCGGNQLAMLDLSRNVALVELDCRVNSLTTLDVSKNTALKSLVCDENQFTTLDTSHNPALVMLSCARNKLMTLDTSQNPALETLDCATNRLTVLNVGWNPVLRKLICLENRLRTLDVGKNTVLKTLICNHNLLLDKSAIIGLDESRLESFIFDPQEDESRGKR